MAYQCNSIADESDDDERDPDPCRVNATFFALVGSCKPRCVERRDDDDCFTCNRECNGSYVK